MEDYDSWVGPLVDGKCKYFQDRGKRWPFYTDERGYKLLRKLVDANMLLLQRNQGLIDATPDPARAVRDGERIYANKPTLKSKAGVTWSQDEYGHPGLQRMYLKMKSYQRYTETFSLLERAERLGVFDDELSSSKESPELIRVAALGGGPGYELLAFRHFFESRNAALKLELTSLDLCSSWGQYANPLGFKFIQWDINEHNLLEKLALEPGQLDYIIISYVFIYCTNDETCEFLKRLLTEGKVKAIIVSERSEATEACVMMEKIGVKVERLMSQELGRDERQNLFLPPGTELTPKSESLKQPMTFPNVPFEEHKKPRQKGGHRLGEPYYSLYLQAHRIIQAGDRSMRSRPLVGIGTSGIVRAHVMRSNVGGVTGGILADIAMLSMIPGDKTDNDTNGMKAHQEIALRNDSTLRGLQALVRTILVILADPVGTRTLLSCIISQLKHL